MHCQHCHHNEATIHLMVGTSDGEKQALHLCLACAMKGIGSADVPLPAGQLAEVLKQFGDTIGAPLLEAITKNDPPPATPEEEPVAAVCPECGTSDVMFRRQQRLGCPRCYEVFADEIRALLPSLHRKGVHHCGRRPSSSETDATRAREQRLRSQRLQEQLQMAVAAEDYERASRLRDELNSLGRSGKGESL